MCLFSVYLCVYVSSHLCSCLWCTPGDQRTTYMVSISSTIWVPGIELWLLGLVTRVLTHWAISSTQTTTSIVLQQLGTHHSKSITGLPPIHCTSQHKGPSHLGWKQFSLSTLVASCPVEKSLVFELNTHRDPRKTLKLPHHLLQEQH